MTTLAERVSAEIHGDHLLVMTDRVIFVVDGRGDPPPRFWRWIAGLTCRTYWFIDDE